MFFFFPDMYELISIMSCQGFVSVAQVTRLGKAQPFLLLLKRWTYVEKHGYKLDVKHEGLVVSYI